MTAMSSGLELLPVHGKRPSAIDAIREAVDAELFAFLEAARAEVASVAPDAAVLVDELSRLVGAGGKRIRPAFCYWGYRAAGGGDGREIVRAGAAIELVHTAAIVHDDLLDGSGHRRGQPTTQHAVVSAGVPARLAWRTAVLAGDLAQALAERLLAESGFPAEMIIAAFGHFDRMRIDAVSGELLDLLWSRGALARATEESARLVASLKAGSYTVTGPVLMGAALAAAGPEVLDALTAYGQPLGEAFQIRDDVLGTFGDPNLTGKDRDADVREGKLTTVLAKARRMASPAVRRLIDDRAALTATDVETVRDGMRTSGALAETLELVGSLVHRAKAALSGAVLEREAAAALASLADVVGTRTG
jgi:geranylgeranyl diphosphate synthase type I